MHIILFLLNAIINFGKKWGGPLVGHQASKGGVPSSNPEPRNKDVGLLCKTE